MRLWTLASALPLCFTVACGMNVQMAHSPGLDTWYEIQTPHFTVETDLPELSARQIARNLEEMRAALLEAAWTGARNPPRGRLDVVVFRTPGEFDRYSGASAQVAGMALSRSGFRRQLSFSPGSENSIPVVVTHEIAHDLSQWFAPIQPTWFAEGMATYLETTKYDASTRTAVMGEVSESRLSSLKYLGGFTPAAKLFAAKESIYLDSRESASFYASAWLFVHFLLNAQGDRFGEFQKRLNRLQEWHQAWDESFPGVTPALLDQQLMAYLEGGGDFTTFTTPVQVEAFEAKVRRLSRAEQHGVLAWLTRSTDREIAEREASEALRLDPNELRALVVRFHMLDRSENTARQEIAKRAVQAHPESSDAWLLLARVQAPGEERRAALRKAQGLEPEHPGVATLLAEDLVQQDRAAEALAYTRLALQRSPLTFDLTQLHLRALLAKSQCRDAQWLESNAEERFREGCTLTVQGAAVSCAEVLRDNWRSQKQACVRAAREAGAAAAAR